MSGTSTSLAFRVLSQLSDGTGVLTNVNAQLRRGQFHYNVASLVSKKKYVALCRPLYINRVVLVVYSRAEFGSSSYIFFCSLLSITSPFFLGNF